MICNGLKSNIEALKVEVFQDLSGYAKIISSAFQLIFPTKGIVSALINIALI